MCYVATVLRYALQAYVMPNTARYVINMRNNLRTTIGELMRLSFLSYKSVVTMSYTIQVEQAKPRMETSAKNAHFRRQ